MSPSNESAAGSARRLDGIDAMRGVAILLVLVYHAGGLEWRLPPWGADGWIVLPRLGIEWLAAPFLHFGFAGVHCFFVLSGFCIHLGAARARAAGRTESPSLSRFFLRRLIRIYPPYWIALAIFGVLVPLAGRWLVDPRGAVPSAVDLGLHAAMLHAFLPSTIFSINPAFWSLATEEQFYLVYPLAGWLLAHLGVRRVLLLAFALSLIWRAAVLIAVPPLPQTPEHFLLYRVLLHAPFPPRWFEWLLGCALAEVVVAPGELLAGRARSLAAAAAAFLVAAMATRVHVGLDKLFSDALFATGFAALTGAVLAARPSSGPAGWIGRALLAIGRRAYGLYLVHQPILDGGWAAKLVRILVAPVAGWLYSAVCERPFEAWARRLGRA